jgi:hypothetical protein
MVHMYLPTAPLTFWGAVLKKCAVSSNIEFETCAKVLGTSCSVTFLVIRCVLLGTHVGGDVYWCIVLCTEPYCDPSQSISRPQCTRYLPSCLSYSNNKPWHQQLLPSCYRDCMSGDNAHEGGEQPVLAGRSLHIPQHKDFELHSRLLKVMIV